MSGDSDHTITPTAIKLRDLMQQEWASRGASPRVDPGFALMIEDALAAAKADPTLIFGKGPPPSRFLGYPPPGATKTPTPPTITGTQMGRVIADEATKIEDTRPQTTPKALRVKTLQTVLDLLAEVEADVRPDADPAFVVILLRDKIQTLIAFEEGPTK